MPQPTIRAACTLLALLLCTLLLHPWQSTAPAHAAGPASLFKDIVPGAGDSSPHDLTVVGNTLFFTADDGRRGDELWKSDGTPGGTVLVKDINFDVNSSSPSDLTVVGSTLFFSANDSSTGEELWKSDGTPGGTTRVKDINPGASSSNPGYLTVVGNTLFFRADDGSRGRELWKSDGTPGGTVLVKDIYSGVEDEGFFPRDLTVMGSTLFFTADDGSSGRELWKSDGTSGGTTRVKDINPGSRAAFYYQDEPYSLTVIGSTLFFTADGGINGQGLWKSDGTSSGTVLVKDDIYVQSITRAIGSTLFFNVRGDQLWKSDGTSDGTIPVRDIDPNSSHYGPQLANMTVVGNTLFFIAYNGSSGLELWKSDGTSAGTMIVKDINPGTASSDPLLSIVVGNTLFFTADDGSSGQELWKSDGTLNGTILVQDINSGVGASYFANNSFAVLNNTLFFNADDGSSGRELWSLPLAPQLPVIPTLNADEDGQPNISFSVSDIDTDVNSLVLSATSDNQTLVPDANLTLGGSSTQRSLSVRPASNQNGTATITVRASDGKSTSTWSFVLTVRPVNDQPTIGALQEQATLVNTAVSVPLTVADIDTPLDALTVTAESSDQALVPNANIVVGGSGRNRTVTITPAMGRQGTGTITVRVSDGTATSSVSFTLTVRPQPWLVLLYLGGDDVGAASNQQSLTGPITKLISEVTQIPYNSTVRIVMLHDGNISGDSRVYVREPNGLLAIPPAQLWPGYPVDDELDTGSPATLRAFVQWAQANYPAQHTFLSLVDHGGGWAPDFGDQPGQGRGRGVQAAGGWRGMSMDLTSPGGTSFSTRDTGEALNGLSHIDVLFFDACLMGMIESAYEVRDAADYLIAGENILFADLPYQEYLAPTQLTAATTPRDLAVSIVDRYNRNQEAERHPFTIAALDLRQLRSNVPNNLAARVNILAERLLTALPDPVPPGHLVQTALQTLHRESQKFDYDNSYTIDPADGYVDLADFARRLRDTSDPAIPNDVKEAAAAVVDAVLATPASTQRATAEAGPVVIGQRTVSGTYEGAPWDFAGATGLSIYLPLGERDNRPTKVDPNNPDLPAQPERQLTYYADPTQLTWTRDVPQWAALLLRLEANTPERLPERGGFTSPNQLPGASLVYLPITVR